MNVSPERVVTLVREGLADAIAADAATLAIAAEFARDAVVYGFRALPREMFRRPSGISIAAMICEDFEAASEIEAGGEGRFVEIAHGEGLLSVVLAQRHPQRVFERVENDRERLWWLRRFVALYGLRNLRVHEVTPAEFARDGAGAVDQLYVKGLDADAALGLGDELLAAGGRLYTWQTGDPSAKVRRPRTNSRGDALRFEREVPARSAPARGRRLVVIGCGARELDAAQPTA